MPETPDAPKRRFNLLFLVPPLAFLALGAGFYLGLERSEELPSALAGRAAPALTLPALSDAYPAPDPNALTAPGMKLVNFFASWCAPCHYEHPTLMRLAAAGIPIIGINKDDTTAGATEFLETLGNPYTAIGVDPNGRYSIDWGVYGLPETFLVDGDGRVLVRFPGPITPEIFADRFAPALGVNLD